jgi:tetratricopeptide (TPR) repeat protein
MLARLAPFALCLTLAASAQADALDDELAATKSLLLADQVEEASAHLDALEASARQAVSANPTDAHAQYIMGMAALYAGRDAVAKTALNTALRLEPRNLTYIMGRAQFALYTDAPKEAVKLLQDALPDNPKSLPLLEMLAGAQRDAQDFAAAQATFQKAADLNPKDPRYLADIADCLASQHKGDEALATYQKALDLDPKFLPALTSIGRLHESRQAWAKAIAAFTQAAALDPNDFRLLAKLVQLHEAAGNPQARDAARDQIFALYKAGKINAASFCRQQFPDGPRTVMVFEYFQLQGPMPVRYAFNIVNPDGKAIEKRLSLGSYDDATARARQAGQIKPDQRLFHLDVYTETTHEQLATFTQEPTYEQTRTLVTQYLATLTPATTPGGNR